MLFGFLLFESGCDAPIRKYFEEIYTPVLYEHSGYDLSSPDTVLNLPADLAEISGLSYLDENHLAAVQDEKGKIFIIDIRDGTITREIKFGKKGDYAGIEIVQGSVYVVKSNGDIVGPHRPSMVYGTGAMPGKALIPKPVCSQTPRLRPAKPTLEVLVPIRPVPR